MEDTGRGMPYYIYVCDNEIKSKFNLFPNLIFIYKILIIISLLGMKIYSC